ncbi:hypothetical protein [Naasia aerilata]|uniref:Uncharacterized protein n=1 Tax=Naasia aerilata TaxID=1162966 RepID=A0ABN6XPB1_9MICO|nr:hypothetical protein [Naasia aerilata]BDZ46844.1 hypothetical protein GCM10025866_27530 [Naasia aerilata]
MDRAPGEPDGLARPDDADEEFTPRRPAWVKAVAWVAVVGLVLGAGFGSALALLAGQRAQSGPEDGVIAVSDVIQERGIGSGTVPLEAAPAEATGLQVRFTCLSPGRFTWGTDPHRNPASSCGDSSVGSALWNEFDLPATPELYITADQDAEWAVEVVYVTREPAQGV